MKIYYAHSRAYYNTDIENGDIELLHELFPEATIVNPNDDIMQELCGNDIEKFCQIVRSCNLLAFSGIPDGRITAGVWQEIQTAMEMNMPIIEIPWLIDRSMSEEETEDMLREMGING